MAITTFKYNGKIIVQDKSVLGSLKADWKPSDISSCELWLDAEKGITLNSGNVSAWEDQSGKGYRAIQPNSRQQPRWVPDGLNGKPTIRLNSRKITNLRVEQFDLSLTNQITVFFVLNLFGANSGIIGSYPPRISEGDFGIYYKNAGGSLYLETGVVDHAFWTIHSAYVPINKNVLLSSTIDKQKFGLERGSVRWNKVNYNMLPTGYDSSSQSRFSRKKLMLIGYFPNSSYAMDGNISEVIIYSSILSDSERAAVEEYLRVKYVLFR